MQAEALLGVAEGGWVTSVHYLGYLAGVITSYTLVTTKQKEQFLLIGLIVSILSTGLMATTTSLLFWSIIRFFAGLSGAAGVIIVKKVVNASNYGLINSPKNLWRTVTEKRIKK